MKSIEKIFRNAKTLLGMQSSVKDGDFPRLSRSLATQSIQLVKKTPMFSVHNHQHSDASLGSHLFHVIGVRIRSMDEVSDLTETCNNIDFLEEDKTSILTELSKKALP